MDTQYENLNEAIAETVSSTNELATEFLVEEGKDVSKIVERGLELIAKLEADIPNLSKRAPYNP